MADLQERSLTISGVKVIFPCKPYPSQFGMMDRVIKGIERRQNGLLESPTGSGKSLALLCSALAWQHAQHEKLMKEKLNTETGIDCCSKCNCGNKEYSPDSKLGRSGSSHNPVELSDEDGDFNDDDDDFKPASKGKSRKHIKICYEDDHTEASPMEKSKCTCSRESKTSDKKPKVPKIYFGTRTHKQIAQIARELKKTAYHDVRMAILASREHTCIHPEVIRLKSKSEGCRERLDSRGPGCKYNDKSKRVFLNQNQLQDSLTTAWDIEDFVNVCKGKKACPYFVTRNILKEADVIFCPYNYLIDPLIRNSMEIDIKDQIIILDEAHNMEDSAREAGSGSLTSDQLNQAIHNLQELLDHNVKFAEHLKLKKLMESTLTLIEDNARHLVQKDFDQSYTTWAGFDIVAHLKPAGLGPDTFQENQACFAKALENDENEAERGRGNPDEKMSSSTIQTIEQLFQVLDYMYRQDMKFVEDYRVAILKTRTFMNNVDTNDMWINSRHRNRASRMMEIHTLNFWCMNPAVAFSDFNPARNVILSSGTLSPMSSFASELGVPFPIQLEANHVIQDKQVWVGAIGRGPSGAQLQAVYKNMEQFGFQDELGQLIYKVCMTVPHGVLCFLPSYRSLEKFTERWKLTGLWRKISERKRIMVEPRAAKKEVFDDMMKAFYKVVQGDTSYDVCEEDEEYCHDDSGIDGALFFAVCRGKVSEGMDFADNNARAVITVGIPYPSIKDLQVKLKREYNDRHRAERGLLSGSEWYEIQAFRALNQALGRCLRHRKDWGALIIVDDRFVRNKEKYCKSLSKWVRSKVQTFENFSQTLDSLSVFTEQMIKDMPVVDADTSFIPSTPGTVRRDSLYRSLDDSITNSPIPGSQGNSSYFSSPPENLTKSVFKTPQSAAKKFIPPPTAGTTSEVSPKGANPSAVQSPVTPSNQQFQQIMEIVKSAGVPKDKPYYIILNQGLPNEQTFLIEPPESKEKDKGANSTSTAPKDLPVIAVPSTQKVMTPTPVAAKLAKMAASTGTLSSAQTGSNSLQGQTGNLIGKKQVPVQQEVGMKNSVHTTSLPNMAATVPKSKSDIIATMTNQIQSSQLLLQNQTLVPLVGSQLVLSQPQGLVLVGNSPAPGQQQVLLTQPQGLAPLPAANMAVAGQHMTSLLGNRTVPLVDTTVKSKNVTIGSTEHNASACKEVEQKSIGDISSNSNVNREVEQKNKFLKFASLPTTGTTPSKIATVAPMRAGTKVKSEAAVTESNEIAVEVKTENGDNPDETNNVTSGKNVDASVDNTNVRKRPLFRARKSLNTQSEASSSAAVKQEQFSDSDGDFKSEKIVRKETKVEKAHAMQSKANETQAKGNATQSKSGVHESKTESKCQKTVYKDVHKLQSEMPVSGGKSFNAAGMTTRRNKPRSSLSLEASETDRDDKFVDKIETNAKPAGSEVNKSVRGETKKSIADKLKQFRRESLDEAGVLTELKTDIHDNDSDFIEKVKSPIASPEQLNTRRRRSGRKRKSSPTMLKNKRSKGVDFEDVVDDPKENQVVDAKPVRCAKCGAVFMENRDFEKRRRNPSFLKKLWPQNTEVLFFPEIDKLEGLQVITSDEQGDVTLNCCYDEQTGCGVQYLKCNGCKGPERIIGARVVFCRTESEFKQYQTWLLYGAVKH